MSNEDIIGLSFLLLVIVATLALALLLAAGALFGAFPWYLRAFCGALDLPLCLMLVGCLRMLREDLR